jgi:hypothetical protein
VLDLSTDLPQVPSDGSQSATISALMKDANNNVLPGIKVHFTANSGALTVTQDTTDAGGIAKATLNAGTDKSNRTITVNVSGGSAPAASIGIAVGGTLLSLSPVPNLVQGNKGTYTVLLTDSANKGIANQAVTVTSALGNAITPASPSTDATGKATFQLTATNAGTDTVVATALGLSATQKTAISSQNFSLTAPASGTKIALGQAQTASVTWLNGGVAQAGQAVQFSVTRGTITGANPATTDANGVASVQISSTTAGPVIISASAAGVTAQTDAIFVATVPASITVQASPSTIPTQSTSTITAVVRDAQNNLVQDQTVLFNVNDPTNGSLSLASVVTDGQGRAQTVFSSSSTTSAANGVTVTATVQGTAVTGQTQLTVGGQTVFLSLGTGNTIQTLNDAQYAVQYAVQTFDAQGAAVPSIPVTLSITPIYYVKGVRTWSGTFWVTPTSPQCASEDVNNNGILDPGEDFNNNGKLDPGGNTATVAPSSGTTDSKGTLLVQVIYPKEYAYWVDVHLTAKATVQGTQSSTSADFLLPGASDDFNTATKAPPGPTSRFGTAGVCTNPN